MSRAALTIAGAGPGRGSLRRSGPPAAVAGAAAAALLLALAGAAGRADAGFAWDGQVMRLLDGAAPVSSSEVHVDPVLSVSAIAVVALTVAFAGHLLLRRRLRAAAFLAAGIVVPVALSAVAKPLVARPAIEGPPTEYTFPSGSATWSMATVVVLALLAGSARRRRVALAAGLPLVAAYGAVIAWEQWHHPSDVVAGWCLAVACASGLWLLLGRPATRARRGGVS